MKSSRTALPIPAVAPVISAVRPLFVLYINLPMLLASRGKLANQARDPPCSDLPRSLSQAEGTQVFLSPPPEAGGYRISEYTSQRWGSPSERGLTGSAPGPARDRRSAVEDLGDHPPLGFFNMSDSSVLCDRVVLVRGALAGSTRHASRSCRP